MNTVLDGLAANPALPAALLDRLIALADPVLSLELARRPDLSPAQVSALLSREEPAVVSVLLRSGQVAPSDVPLSNPSVALVVTEHPSCPPSATRSLAAHPEFKTRLPEWAHALPADVIELLARDPDPAVVAELVTFHALPGALASELSRHPSAEVRRALAASPHTPADVLARLTTFARELAANPATPASVAAGLVRHHEARYWLASRTDLPREVYEQLAGEVEPGILAELAANPSVPADVLRQLTGTRALQRALLRNPAIPLDLLVQVVGTARIGSSPVPRVLVASESELRVLAALATMQARMVVAARPDLPLDLFQRLVVDPDPGVAAAVVTSPLVTVDQLWALAERHGARLFPRVARNSACSPELLHHMALRADGVEETFRAIARHPRASGETLSLCLEDAQARHLAAGHPHLPVDKIVEMLGSEFTAGAAAANPSLPVAVMEELLDRSGA